MKRTAITALLLALALAACATDDATTTTTAGDTTTAAADTTTTEAAATTTEAAAGEDTLVVATNDLGDILQDGEGRTLYLFMPDEQGGEPTCYDTCAENWPAFVETVTAGDGVDASLLTTATRTDDAGVQVVYNGWPLYYFAGDEAPGDTNGQGLNDIWWVVDATGNAISG
jgi:predicted lipoprotein with Yx(FWY)xxD motif